MDRQLSLDVKACARGLGFDLVGITTADPLPEDGARMAQWVAAGMHGEMDYMSRHMPTAAHPGTHLSLLPAACGDAFPPMPGEPTTMR